MHRSNGRSGGGTADAKQLASRIVRALGLEVGVTFPGFKGGSKNCCGITASSGSGSLASLQRVLVEAAWQSDGMLKAVKTTLAALSSFTPIPPSNWNSQLGGTPARRIELS